jgi:carbonic anhydrase
VAHTNRRSRTIDVVYRFDPARRRRRAPRTPREALARLVRGNRRFAGVLHSPGRTSVVPLDPSALGFGAEEGKAPEQQPFAAVLGCSDARAPVEMILQQQSNDLFVVRMAGNGVGASSLGSLRYAAAHFPRSLRLVAVLGHSQCGAVTAAVDAYLRPRSYLPLAANQPLRAIVDAILVAVRSASLALKAAHGPGATARPGYRSALVETSVVLNAALAAYALKQELDSPRLRVVFGSYDLASRSVRLPVSPGRAAGREIGFFPPPEGHDGFIDLALRVAGSGTITALLGGGGSAKRRR